MSNVQCTLSKVPQDFCMGDFMILSDAFSRKRVEDNKNNVEIREFP